MKTINNKWAIAFKASGVILALLAANEGAFADVVNPDLNKYGNSYGEWSARWWQWALSIPTNINPVVDTTGANCDKRQSGPVWFLAGTFGGDPVTRSCTVPKGKALFFPILNSVWGGEGDGCRAPGDCNIPQLRIFAAKDENNPTLLEAHIDGVEVANPKTYRVTSAAFEAFIPAENPFGVAPTTLRPMVADGYWLLVEPLAPGAHTIHFKGIQSNGFTTEVTYNLTVQ